MSKLQIHFLLISAFFFANPVLAFWGNKDSKTKETVSPAPIASPVEQSTELPTIRLNQPLTEEGNSEDYGRKQSEANTIKEYLQKDQEQKSRSEFKKDSEKTSETKNTNSNNAKSKQSKPSKGKGKSVEETKKELKENEKQALDFIFPSIDPEQPSSSGENFFSKTEREQLLELWRATLARNRTIQFIIKSLSSNPNEQEKNSAVMQALSKALFVPFYAVAAVSNNSLVSGGTSVGARVIGDIVESQSEAKDRSREITRTDLIVLFMLVDEVANRLRNSYYEYKESRSEKRLVEFELNPARLDHDEALKNKDNNSIYFTRMVIRDLERRTRVNKLKFANSRRNLVELAGEEAVESVDLLIDLEIEESMQDVLGV